MGRRFAAPGLLRTQFRSTGFSVSAKVTSTISGTGQGTQSSFVRHSSLVAVVIMRLARAAIADELLPVVAPPTGAFEFHCKFQQESNGMQGAFFFKDGDTVAGAGAAPASSSTSSSSSSSDYYVN